MFEAVRRLWLGALLIAAASGFLLLSDAKQRTGAVPRAAILQFSSMGVLDEGARGLTDYLKEHGYDGRHKVLIDRFNAENDVATSSAMAKEIASGKYEFAISISTNCLQAVANANREGKAKHLFGIVADPLAAKVGINPNDPSDKPKHMTGIGTLMPISELMEVARAMNPRLRRFGIPWNPSQANSLRYMQLAHEAAREQGVEILEGSVDNSGAVGEVTDSLVARGAEIIVIIGDVTVGLAVDAVIGAARKGRVPVISALPTDIKRGALFAAGADFYAVGRQMGEMAVRLFEGADPAKMPVNYSLPKVYGVNLKVPPTLRDRWTVPADLIQKSITVIR